MKLSFENHKLDALMITIGIIILGFCIEGGLKSISGNSRVVNVKGLSEMEVKANKVTWPITMKFVGNDLESIYSQVSNSNSVVREFLTSHGIKTSEITDNAPTITDKMAEVYNENQSSQNRYTVTNVVTVSTNHVDLVRALMSKQSELLRKGVAISGGNYENPVVYEYTDLNKIKPRMIEEATKSARAAAEKFAKDSESDLGKIKNASQGLFSIDDRDVNTPFIKKVRVVTTVDYYLND
jgi:hypothetical protein